jgi:uncharacterized membrane protein YbhN (UPF0104 family)
MTTTDPVDVGSDSAEDQKRRLRRGLLSVALLVVLVVALVLAVPGLHGVANRLSDMSGSLIAVAVVLEILSCFGYVLTFMLVFDRAPLLFAARVAWTEMAFGAAVALGGAGSLGIGAWLLTQRGAPVGRVAQRSAVLFLLTSAVNVITLVVFALGEGIGVFDGPRNPLLTFLPAGVGIATLAFFLALPKVMGRRGGTRGEGRLAKILDGTASSIRDSARMLVTPDWRLVGAVAYLLCDIAVLWVCLDAAGHPLPFAPVVLAYQIAYLSNIIPVPGNIGVLDGSLIGMLTLYGANPTTAAAAAVVYHAIALWIPSLIGTIAFIRLQRSAGQPVTLRPPKAERRRARSRARGRAERMTRRGGED